MRTCIFLISLCLPVWAVAQIPVDLSGLRDDNHTEVVEDGEFLQVTWPAAAGQQARLRIDLRENAPLFQSMQLDQGEDGFTEIGAELDPAFILTVGKRNLAENGWTIFFDETPYQPYEVYRAVLQKQSARVESSGTRTRVIVSEVRAGDFTGDVEVTFYEGSPLLNISAAVSTEVDSAAILYDAGILSKGENWKQISWADPEDHVQSQQLEQPADARNLAVKYRAIAGESDSGSLAVFPAPHQYFYPLDNAYNLAFTWYGQGYRDQFTESGIGIRQELMGDRRWVPWFNAPPGTRQRLNFFCLLSTEKDGRVLEAVKRFTHGDAYKPLPGYYTMASHFHTEHTDDVLTHKPLPEIPGFVKAMRNTGVNIMHLGEFHLAGNPRDKGPRRLSEFKKMFEECKRLSGGDFLMLPGEEPNSHFGGHWMNLFPEPVYWIMSRDEGEPFVEEDPEYGKVYRVGNAGEMLKLLQAENGLAWTAHARIKGSRGYPDKYKEEGFYRSDRFLGAAWKAMPADLSLPKLGLRVLDLMDDMANWGQRKYVIGEADVFKIEPDYELYAHMNINYLQLDRLPSFDDGWQPVLDAMQSGKFFVSTGEVLLPEFTVNGAGSGETVTLDNSGKATASVKIDWTFPLNYVEIISGDGEEVYREKIEMHQTEAFGKERFDFEINLKDRKWVRLEAWDAAANGAFTQFVWLNQ